MSNTEALRAALQAAREARDAIPLGAERSALNVALDRLDVALSAAAALAQPAASGEPVAWGGTPNSPSDPKICNERSAQVSGPVYCGDSGSYCSACPKRVTAPAPLPACKGMNCGATDGRSHSLECHAEHAAAIAGGVFVPATAQPAPARVPADLVALMDLADDYAKKLADAHAERLYGTSESYTKQCIGNANKARTALHNALAGTPAKEAP